MYNVFCDIHSHILWAIDDGAADMEASLTMLKKACADGISHIIATPHHLPRKYEVSSGLVSARVDEINRLAADNNLDIKIYPGCEMAADITSFKLLAEGQIPSLCNSSYILLELYQDYTKDCIINMIDEVLRMGYTPVIAHAERSILHRLGISFIKSLVLQGALISVNASSVVGHHASLAQRSYVKKLLKSGLVFAVASDCHSLDLRPPILSEAAQITEKYIGSIEAQKLFWTNPMKILKNIPYTNVT